MRQTSTNETLTSFITDVNPIKAELNVVALIARRNVSFSFVTHLLEMLHFVANDSKAVKKMTCSRTKTSYLLTECLAVYAHEDTVKQMKEAVGFPILCNKATDVAMKKIFCVSVRYVDSSRRPKTVLY